MTCENHDSQIRNGWTVCADCGELLRDRTEIDNMLEESGILEHADLLISPAWAEARVELCQPSAFLPKIF